MVEGIAYIVHMREGYCFSLMCTSKKATVFGYKGRCTKGSPKV